MLAKKINHMLPKIRRIKDRHIFTDIYKSGRRTFTPHITLYFKKTDGFSRFACVISQKVSKKAVLRNKLRRRTYAIIKNHLSGIKEGYAIILVFKKGATDLTYSQLEGFVLEIFKKAKLLN